MSDYKKLSIKNWAVEDRPREKIMKQGMAALSNAELFAILIGSGNRDESAVELARRILADYKNDLDLLSRVSIKQLTKFKGMGPAKAINVMAALELGRRANLFVKTENSRITSSEDANKLMALNLKDLNHEEFWVLYLDRGNKVNEKHKISQGGITGTVIDLRLIMKKAVESLCVSIILVHNHPSGNLSPSQADLDITKKIKDAARLFDIKLLDHLIITQKAYTSFADEGLLG